MLLLLVLLGRAAVDAHDLEAVVGIAARHTRPRLAAGAATKSSTIRSVVLLAVCRVAEQLFVVMLLLAVEQ